ncbi:DUF3046 domain-containing protein [Agrococcus sp. ARC_14]|uniref:DUF3046 domain-containing protein n=1 Tax=Agrococcus sp. ARC_14 TaxID=2919927 RepID=UPI001F0539DB|nr:DUF3046 domain-containing protein [Agrococcus sp. ARC_14]MCH1883612.1 DUF3046 domain-containing protein [Agrococcus sp. ARC_14]
MRTSELQIALTEEFGALGAVLMADLTLGSLGGRTGAEALASGMPARQVWQALCDAKDVPADRRHGRGLRDPRR